MAFEKKKKGFFGRLSERIGDVIDPGPSDIRSSDNFLRIPRPGGRIPDI